LYKKDEAFGQFVCSVRDRHNRGLVVCSVPQGGFALRRLPIHFKVGTGGTIKLTDRTGVLAEYGR
jgi:hypothetical protein